MSEKMKDKVILYFLIPWCVLFPTLTAAYLFQDLDHPVLGTWAVLVFMLMAVLTSTKRVTR